MADEKDPSGGHASSNSSLPPPETITTPAITSDPERATGGYVDEAALLRKLDWRVLPPVFILYLLSFLDRSNVGNAKIEGLTEDLNMSGAQYLNGLTLFFLGYVLFEVPCNIILKRTSPRVWLPTLTIAWGVVSTLMGIVTNTAGFLSTRFFLGVTEGGLFPGVVFYLSMWYTRRVRTYRIALFFSAAALAGSFGGILAFGIGRMKGIVWVNGWRWIFILEGIFTVVVAFLGYVVICNYPDTAKFLTADERENIQRQLSADSDATKHEEFSWEGVKEALTDLNCWLYGFGFHTMSLPMYTMSLFMPTIISALGYTSAKAQLLTVPPYAFAFLATLSLTVISERVGKRFPFIIGSTLFACVGYAILLSNTDPLTNPGLSYAGTFLAAGGIYPSVALVLSWPAINVSGQTKRAVSNAMQISVGNVGAIIGMQLYRSGDSPRFVVGHGVALGYLVGNLGVVGWLGWRLQRENKRRDEIAKGAGGEGEGAAAVVTARIGEVEDWQGDKDLRWRYVY